MFDWNGNGKKDLFDSYIDYKIFEAVFEEDSNSYDSTTYNATDFDYDYDYDSYDFDSSDSISDYSHSTLDLDKDYISTLEAEGDALKSENESFEANDDSYVFNESVDIFLGKLIYAIYIISGFMIYVSIIGIFEAPLKLWFYTLIISLIVYLFIRKSIK